MRYLGKRLLAAAIMVAVAGTICFFTIHLLPGDPVAMLLGEHGSKDPEVVERIRRKLHLDLPLPTQFLRWAAALAMLDLGASLQTGLPVASELARRIPRSLELIAAGLAIAVAFGIPIGMLAGRRANAAAGWLASAVAVLCFSSPAFVTGLLLVMGFSIGLGILPSSGYAALSDGAAEHLRYAVLPSLTLGIGFMGVVIRMTRASLLDTMAKDFIRTARAKGVPERSVMLDHALPNSLIPVVAVLGVRAGNLLGGTVIIETLFNWPGLSSLLVQACYDRDYPVIQGTLLAIFVLFVAVSLLVDLCLGLLDPKLRHGSA